MKNRVVVFEQDNKQVIKEGNFFFTSIIENGESFESGDFKSLRRAKESLGIVPTLTETNRLLAKFLGRNGKVNKNLYSWDGIDLLLTGGWVEVKGMKFHSDWNWLMQVVEKIESLGVNFWVVKNKVNLTIVGELAQKLNNLYNTEFEGYDFEYYKGNTKIEAVYNACVEFVKWYNENK